MKDSLAKSKKNINHMNKGNRQLKTRAYIYLIQITVRVRATESFSCLLEK